MKKIPVLKSTDEKIKKIKNANIYVDKLTNVLTYVKFAKLDVQGFTHGWKTLYLKDGLSLSVFPIPVVFQGVSFSTKTRWIYPSI